MPKSYQYYFNQQALNTSDVSPTKIFNELGNPTGLLTKVGNQYNLFLNDTQNQRFGLLQFNNSSSVDPENPISTVKITPKSYYIKPDGLERVQQILISGLNKTDNDVNLKNGDVSFVIWMS